MEWREDGIKMMEAEKEQIEESKKETELAMPPEEPVSTRLKETERNSPIRVWEEGAIASILQVGKPEQGESRLGAD